MASSITISGVDVSLTTEAGTEAVARRQVTTAAPSQQVSFGFGVARRALYMRIGSTAGGQDILPDVPFEPGDHIVSITPGASTYYVEFRLKGIGSAELLGFERLASGDLEVPTPWRESDLSALRHEQSLNAEWWFLEAEEPRVFERRGENSWSLRRYQPGNGPFGALNLSDTTLTPSARTGSATITASSPVFTVQDEGSLIRLTHAGQFETEILTSVDDVTEAIRVAGVGASRIFYYDISGSFTGSVVLERSVGNELNYVTVNTFSGAASGSLNDDFDNQVIYYRLRCTVLSSGSSTVELTYGAGVTDGVGRIVSVEADNEVTVDVIDAFGKTSATTLWYLGAWSSRLGYPAAAALFDGRLYMSRKNAYWGSAPDDFEDFAVTALPDGAISRSFPGRMSSARWMLSGDSLMVGLSGQEQVIGSGALDEVITPANVRARPRSNKGSAQTGAVLVNDAAVFVSRSLERLYRFSPEEPIETRLLDLTRLNKAIAGASGFSEIAYQVDPEPRIWAVRNDGQVAVLVFDPVERVLGWTRLVFDGVVESICILPAQPEDQVYVVVRRTVGGSQVRFIELVQPEAWDTSSSAWRLHAALEYSGTSTSTLTGLDHLEGRTDVYVWGNGRQSGPYTVSGGSITLTHEVTYAIAGLKYTGKYKGPRLNWGGRRGTALTEHKQISRLGLMVSNTPGGMLKWGRGFGDNELEVLKDRREGDSYDSPLTLWNDDFNEPFEGGTDTDPRVHIVMDGAGPASVLGLVPKMSTKDG